MAQRDTKSTGMKERPSSITLQNSLSQPAPSNLTTNQPQINRRRYSTLPTSLNTNNYPLSPAEHYISLRSQMLFNSSNPQQGAISPETPSSISTKSFTSIPSSMSHAEVMHNWHQKKLTEIGKKHKHRYVYGTPSPPPVTSPMSFNFTFSLPPTQTNTSLSPQISSTQTEKKDKSTEFCNKVKKFSVV